MRDVLLEWSLWGSERIGWPVVGAAGVGLVAAWAAVAVAGERARKRRLRVWAFRDREGER